MGAGKKNVVFLNNGLTMDGQNVILVNILKRLDTSKYDITLLLLDNNGEKDVLMSSVPDHIKIIFLRPSDIMKKVLYYKSLKRNIFQKIYYNHLLSKLTSVARRQTVKHTEEISREKGEIDVFVDFGDNARKYVDKIKANKKIVWRHHAFAHVELKKRTRYFNNLSKFDKIVTICKDMYNEIVEYAPNLANKACVAYNPIDLERISSLAKDTQGLSQENIERLKEDYIVTVARLHLGQKDYITLINAYKIAKERGFNWKLYIIGDGVDRDRVTQLIEENGLSNDIIMLGLQKTPFVFVKNAKFFVLSSKDEGLPTVVIEALSLNVPVISSDCPTGPAEILQNGKYGMLVPVGDAQAMADGFLKMYNNHELREKYATAGSMRAKDFSIEKTMKVIEQIIDE